MILLFLIILILDEFEYSDKKEDYFLFVGRVYDGKGLNIAIQATQAIGAKLKVAGQLSGHYAEPDFVWPANVEFMGYVGMEDRKNLMKGRNCIVLTIYVCRTFWWSSN